MKVFRNRAFRWVLLMFGLAAIIALTGMNLFSLYDLRERMVEGEQQKRIDQVEEIYRTIRYELYSPTEGLYKLELNNLENSIANTGQFRNSVMDVLRETSQSPFFVDLYYTPYGVDPCETGSRIYYFDKENDELELRTDYPEAICDGVGLARTKAKIRLNDLDYRWNTTTEFDDNRTMNIGLINVAQGKIIGYFTFTFDNDYIVNDFIAPKLNEYFGDSEESGVIAWLQNWVSTDILATNAPTIPYDRDLVSYRHSFPSFFNNWIIKLAFQENPVASAYTATLAKNLAVLGVAVLFLLGALIFMFITAQRERHLAQRQASFLANVTHELKTPLAVMQAAGENISDGRVSEPDRLRKYGEHIYNESIRLRGMIEKLLDVAKADSGQTNINREARKPVQLLREYLDENRTYIENKGFKVVFESNDQGSVCNIDSDSFETILSNLTENAVKYSKEEKFIKYSIHSDQTHLYLEVTDHGIGIPKKALRSIFNKFYRVEDSMNAKTKGHGLGLSIVRNMVELNGGSINADSTLGEGTTFTVTFPIMMESDTTVTNRKKRITSDTIILESTEHVG